MKVLLVAPPIVDEIDGRLSVVGVDALRECPPLGIYTLASVLEAHGHDVTVADLILHGTRMLDAFERDVENADLVGIGATSMAWPAALDVLRQVRARRPDVPIVCGGIHPTLFDRYILNTFPVQFVVRGEGEVAIARLCAALANGLDLGSVPNLSWIDGAGRLVRNAVDPKLQIDELAERASSALGAPARRLVQVSGDRVITRMRVRLFVLQHALSQDVARSRDRRRRRAPGACARPSRQDDDRLRAHCR